MASNQKYKFKKPIRRGSELIEEVMVRAPALRDLKALEGITGTFTRAAKMIELVTGLSESEVEQISLEDMREIGELIRPFFIDSPSATTS